MADPRPRLEVVSGGTPGESAGPPPAPRRRGWLPWLLGGLLLLALLIGGLESRRAAELSRQVTGLTAEVEQLSAELSAAETALEAHRGHLDEVRASVAELQALVSRDPETPAR